MVRAIWNGAVLAESDDTVVVEGNHYFPPDALNEEYFASSDHHTVCSWKGRASYYGIVVDGRVNPAAAWFYPEPRPAAEAVRGRVAFWHGVRVDDKPTRHHYDHRDLVGQHAGPLAGLRRRLLGR